MKSDIILAGVGGQGILSIAAVLGAAALNENYYLKQAETHGMSQRGGEVVSHLRISDRPVHSDLIPLGKAGLILSVEPLESLRYLPYLSAQGTLVTNTVEFRNIVNYPDIKKIFEELAGKLKMIRINADQLAKDMGNPRASNMVMLGAASPFIEISPEIIIKGIKDVFKPKGKKIVGSNIDLFLEGRKFSEGQ
ncbi:MAG: indolepyruvate oxidoreductase subunit beta [Bacteroidales bacterium]|nr:indolepyruvate oxidoreductase subunit beta [Bacteroidales bacterium]